MNAQDLFAGSQDARPRVVLSTSFLADPYVPLLTTAGFDCRRADGPTLYDMLLKENVDIALIQVMDFARINRHGWRVLKNAALSCSTESGIARVSFAGASSLDRICVDESSLLFWHWLDLILLERFETEAHPVRDNCPENMPRLFAGLPALEKGGEHDWDVAEQWGEMTNTPLTTHLWLVRESVDAKSIERLDALFRKPFVSDNPAFNRLISRHIKRDFDEASREGLAEFYRYAFFHGRIDYMPEIKFWGGASDTEREG